jgi:UDP-N-acetylglucosamine--N-acetylmuramyl-(pentapeptide) pyrophosphoryl-undecaprenol N-acetylglucosamine transferase
VKFALAGGGTGGHAYPALAVAERLRERVDTELVYYGTEHGPERALAEEQEIDYRVVPAAQFRGRSPVRVTHGAWSFYRGSRVARRWFREDRPDAVFATGGYGAAPIGRAARQQRIPLIVFLPDIKPGWAVKLLQRYANTVACSVDGSLPYLNSSKAVVTGYPVRRQFSEATRDEGIRRFGLDAAVQTLLIAGGSLGAHQINLQVSEALPRLLPRLQIIHVSGRDEFDWLDRERNRLPDWQKERYHLHAYTEEMAYAMAAADLAVMRAGASTLGELPAMGLPAILIPGGFSDQSLNASYLEERGAAVVLTSATIDRLTDDVEGLLDDGERRDAMSEAMRAVSQPDAASRIANLLREAVR